MLTESIFETSKLAKNFLSIFEIWFAWRWLVTCCPCKTLFRKNVMDVPFKHQYVQGSWIHWSARPQHWQGSSCSSQACSLGGQMRLHVFVSFFLSCHHGTKRKDNPSKHIWRFWERFSKKKNHKESSPDVPFPAQRLHKGPGFLLRVNSHESSLMNVSSGKD